MADDFDTYLKKIHFEKYIKKLSKKLANKNVIIYGCGTFFRYIKDHYDLSNLNIIGISDMKFADEQEGEEYLGYKIIPKSKILSYAPDYVLVAMLEYIRIVEDFQINVFDKTKTKVYPLARIPLIQMIKKIWVG